VRAGGDGVDERSDAMSTPSKTGAGVRAELFEPAQTVPQDWARLADYLATQGMRLTGTPRQFSQGFGNLNFLIEVDGRPAVLRRPPVGPIPPGANDMKREHRILSRLWQAFPLAPRSLLYCESPDVLGAHFLVMEYRAGRVVRGEMPADLAAVPDAGARLGHLLVELMARIHGVDCVAVGLADLGRPEGFLQRTVEGWAKRAAIAYDGPAPAEVDELVGWLRARRCPEQASALLHNDFKLDNVILDAEGREPVAVLDWDMGTRGDPLFDLATLLSYWTQAGDPPAMHDLKQMPTAGHGFATRSEAVELYARLTGRDVSDFMYYRVLTMLKIGIVFAQIHAQYRRGTSTNPRFEPLGRLAQGLLEFGVEIARGRAF